MKLQGFRRPNSNFSFKPGDKFCGLLDELVIWYFCYNKRQDITHYVEALTTWCDKDCYLVKKDDDNEDDDENDENNNDNTGGNNNDNDQDNDDYLIKIIIIIIIIIIIFITIIIIIIIIINESLYMIFL